MKYKKQLKIMKNITKSILIIILAFVTIKAESVPTYDNPEFVSCSLVLFPSPCPKNILKVCGLYSPFKYECKEENCGKQYFNDCEACLSGEIHGYVPGECKKIGIPVENNPKKIIEQKPKINICTENVKNRNNKLKPKDDELKFCTMEYNPTCGNLFECKDGVCFKEYGNPCGACSDPDVESYEIGPCPEVKPINEPTPEDGFTYCPTIPTLALCIQIEDPVCGYYEKSEKCADFDCRRTFSNGCMACNDSEVVKHIPGKCEENNTDTPILIIDPPPYIQCNAATFVTPCPEENSYSCGYFKDGVECSGNACWADFLNPCKACADPRVAEVHPGSCPDPFPIDPIPSNEPVLCAAASFLNPCPNEIYPTCGYFKSEVPCKNGNCFAEFDNGCVACGDNRVESFKSGPCPEIKTEDEDELDENTNKNYVCKPKDRYKNCKCNSKNSLFCAKTKITSYLSNVYEYFKCKCDACSDRHVVSVKKGLCPGHSGLDKVKPYFCKSKDRMMGCTEEWKGVCAITESGLITVGTVCQGCQNSDVIAVYDTKCPPNN